MTAPSEATSGNGARPILSAEARVATDRASRYLVQLCEYIKRLGVHGRHGPEFHRGTPPQVRVEWSDTRGVVVFVVGQRTLDACADALTLRLDAASQEGLQRMKDMFTMRLEKIGRRDNPIVAW